MKSFHLANGLTLSSTDHSRRYYGDYHQVRITVSASIPLLPTFFSTTREYENAVQLLGSEIPYSRTLERMGVPGAEIGQVRDSLLQQFSDNALSYLSSPSFPARHAAQAYARRLARGKFHP